MAAVAGRLDAVTDETAAAAVLLDSGAGEDLGPGGVGAALDTVTSAWVRRLGEAGEDAAAGAGEVRAARDTYLDVDETAAGAIRRGG